LPSYPVISNEVGCKQSSHTYELHLSTQTIIQSKALHSQGRASGEIVYMQAFPAAGLLDTAHLVVNQESVTVLIQST
jgi:hypothetical protein